MRTDRLFLLVGILLIALPYIGVPDSWKSMLVVVLGIVLVVTSVLMRHRRTLENGRQGEGAVAVENPIKSQEDYA